MIFRTSSKIQDEHDEWTLVAPPFEDHSEIVEASEFAVPEPQSSEAQETSTRSHQDRFLIGPASFWMTVYLRLEGGWLMVADKTQRMLAFESARNTGFLFTPIALGLGILIYFHLPREPLLLAFPVVLIVLLIFLMKLDRSHISWHAFCAGTLIIFGICIAQLRAQIINTPMLSQSVTTLVTGRVVKIENRANGSGRYTLDRLQFDNKVKLSGSTPGQARITARRAVETLQIGNRISGVARLSPPPGPVYPGAYDFAFQTWYAGIGASGFFLGGANRVPTSTSSDILEIRLVIEQLRSGLGNILRAVLPGEEGHLAVALITGDRSGISEQTAEALRRSGLAHILAISGLHMALVAMTLMTGIRAILALVPTVALFYPVKKWSAGTALLGATVYLTISGANVSTQRAYIMVAIMLLAIMIDRRALTMRNVAVAALVVLVMTPEALTSPGFQMSFAAVAGLVATYEALSGRKNRSHMVPRPGVLASVQRFLIRDIGGLALTSLVAGLATGLFAAFHFHQVAPLGLVANLLAMPMVSLAVMPSALLGVIAIPFGLESYPLAIMAYALSGVVYIAELISRIGPSGEVGIIPIFTLTVGALALLTLTMFRSVLRWIGVPLLLIAAIGTQYKPAPFLLVLENGRQMAVRSAESLVLLRPRLCGNSVCFSISALRSIIGARSIVLFKV